MKFPCIALLPLAENLSGSNSLLPGSIITYPQGTTVEVCNTDCEGRMILADAIIHSCRLGAKTVIDIATLTGNIGMALGDSLAGVWGDKTICEDLINIGEEIGDRLWKMPLITEYEKHLKSDVAYIKNLPADRKAGAVTAALFLRHFINSIGSSITWAHIDMEAVAAIDTPYGYLTKGASGFGARLLAEFCRRL